MQSHDHGFHPGRQAIEIKTCEIRLRPSQAQYRKLDRDAMHGSDALHTGRKRCTGPGIDEDDVGSLPQPAQYGLHLPPFGGSAVPCIVGQHPHALPHHQFFAQCRPLDTAQRRLHVGEPHSPLVFDAKQDIQSPGVEISIDQRAIMAEIGHLPSQPRDQHTETKTPAHGCAHHDVTAPGFIGRSLGHHSPATLYAMYHAAAHPRGTDLSGTGWGHDGNLGRVVPCWTSRVEPSAVAAARCGDTRIIAHDTIEPP